MNYRSYTDLNSTILKHLFLIPQDAGLVVGVPRSGMIPALMIALYRNLPVTDVDGFKKGIVMEGGIRSKYRKSNFKKNRTVIVVDDSVSSGKSMEKVKKNLSKIKDVKFVYISIYIKPGSENMVDIYFEKCPLPRVFEWNFMHHFELENSCIDLDGILCRDPTIDENDDGPNYEKFINTVEPYIIPSVKVGIIVTCRLEKYRIQTEKWLKKHGVQYDNLVMMDLPDKKTRIALGNHSLYKADIYKKSNKHLFIDSSDSQAREIAKISKKDVFCAETRKIYPGNVNEDADRNKKSTNKKHLTERFRNLFRKI